MRKYLILPFLFLIASMARAQGPLSPVTFSTGNITTNAANCNTTNVCVIAHLPNNSAGATFTLAGTFTGTVTFEASADNQLTWPIAEGSATVAGATSISLSGTGITDLRMRGSAAMTGAAIATISVSLNTGPVGPTGPTGPAGGGVSSSQLNAFTNFITVSPNCPTPATTPISCYQVAMDVQLVNDGSWANASPTVTTGGTDPVFKCPGSSYPCTAATPGCTQPSTTCDVGKVAQGTANCDVISPGNCFIAYNTVTISSITSAHVAVMSGNSSRISTANSNFAWGTDDDTVLAAAYDACAVVSSGGCRLQLPCGNMFFHTSIFNSFRVTRGLNSIAIMGCGGSGTQLIPRFGFTCQNTNGCYMGLNRTCGQNFIWACTDSAEDIQFNQMGLDANPGNSSFPGAPGYALVKAVQGTYMKNIIVYGSLWNVVSSFPIYGHECDGCTWVNNVSYAAGNFSCHLTNPTFGEGMAVVGGFCNSSAYTGCVIDGATSNVVTVGVMCGFPLGTNYGGNTNDVLGAAVSVTAGNWLSIGDYMQSGVMVSGTGSAILHGTRIDHDANFIDGIRMSSSGYVSMCDVWFRGANTNWVTVSAGTIYDNCHNDYAASPAFVVSGTGAIVRAGTQTAVTSGTAYTNATTTFSDVVGNAGQKLTFPVTVNGTYQVSCNILWQGSAATTGPKFQWTGPASPTSVTASLNTAVTSVSTIQATATAFSSPMADTGVITTATNFIANVTLGLVNGANAGNVTLQAAANGAGTLTIQPGSSCHMAPNQ